MDDAPDVQLWGDCRAANINDVISTADNGYYTISVAKQPPLDRLEPPPESRDEAEIANAVIVKADTTHPFCF